MEFFKGERFTSNYVKHINTYIVQIINVFIILKPYE